MMSKDQNCELAINAISVNHIQIYLLSVGYQIQQISA